MVDIAPVGQSNAALPTTAADSGAASFNELFTQGIAQFMATQIQSAESDVQESCNDTTSQPDDPTA